MIRSASRGRRGASGEGACENRIAASKNGRQNAADRARAKIAYMTDRGNLSTIKNRKDPA